MLTFVLINPDNNYTLVSADADQFVDGTDTTPRQLAEQYHAFNVIVLQQMDVCTHVGN